MPPLPAELLHEIISYLTPFQQAKVCTVCIRFDDITLPVLYSRVNLRSISRAIECCQTLLVASLVRRTSWVRTFIICPEDDSDADTHYLLRLLDQVLPLLCNVQHLHLWIPNYDDTLFNALPGLMLPHLRRFCCHQPGYASSLPLPAFLVRHPAITHLEITPPFKADTALSLPQMRMNLPALREYRGSATYFACISLTHKSLASVAFWNVSDWQSVLPPIMKTLARSTTRAVPFSFSFLYDGFVSKDVQLLHLLARSIPYLHELELGPFCRPPCVLTLELVDRVASALAAFRTLAVFRFNNSLGGTETTPPDLADADRAALIQWGERCPSLQEIQMYNRSWLRAANGRFSPT
ncbi:hypothetical protein DFH06DRAFT_443073 [Mycena polygramma]|nr:hypothetical protein DFH06DRAFT_443073 [Mycena polygramma]